MFLNGLLKLSAFTKLLLAQLMNFQIMKSLKEVPETALESLKSSLLEHVERLCHISPVIATQVV